MLGSGARAVAIGVAVATWSTLSILGQETKGNPEQASVLRAEQAPDTRIRVTFDEKAPGVVIVESNGERLRIDTSQKTFETLSASPAPPEGMPPSDAAGTKKEDEESAYDFDRGDEPYGSRIVNVSTPRSVPKRSWNVDFTLRFSQPIHPLSQSGPALLGLDSFGTASFGITYGITDKLFVTGYRSPLCQTGLCRAIEVGFGYSWLANDKEHPLALTTYASVEGNDNFTEEFTYNLQARFAARLGKRVYAFFSPAVHINANGQRRFDPRASNYSPPATVAETFRLPKHGASFGLGAAVLITPNVVALFDIVPRTGFKLGRVRPIFDNNFHVIGFTNESHVSLGLGIQRNVGKHSFALTFSNTQATTTARYNSSNLALKPKRLIIGFNLSRRF